MPIIHVEMWPGRSVAQKREVAKAITDAMVRISQWWDSLDLHSRDIVRTADFSQGLYEQGYFSAFPGLYALLAGNPMGTFDATLNDIIACGRRAHYQLDEQAEPVSDVHEVVG